MHLLPLRDATHSSGAAGLGAEGVRERLRPLRPSQFLHAPTQLSRLQNRKVEVSCLLVGYAHDAALKGTMQVQSGHPSQGKVTRCLLKTSHMF